MKVTVSWSGNEDGAKRFLVPSGVEALRVDVIVPARTPDYGERALDEAPPIEVTVEKREPDAPAPREDAPKGEAVAGKVFSVRIPVAKDVDFRVSRHARRWILVREKGSGTALAKVPLLVIPAWEITVATLLSAAGIVVLVAWALDVYAALPKSHWAVTIGKVLGLPVAATVGARLSGLLKRRDGALPWLGVFHLLERALGVVALALAAIVAGRSGLIAVENATAATLRFDDGKWSLAPNERVVIVRRELKATDENVLPEHGMEGPGLDHWLDILAPPSTAFRCKPILVPREWLADGCKDAMKENACNLSSSADCKAGVDVALRADVLSPDAGAARGPSGPRLLVTPWPQATPSWEEYLRVRMPVHDDDATPRPRLIAFRRINGPALLVMDAPLSSKDPAVAVSPYRLDEHMFDATIEESPNAGSIATGADAQREIAAPGGDVTCYGAASPKGEVVIDAFGARPNAIHSLTVTLEQQSKWLSTFTAHAVGSPHAWLCAPSDGESTPSYDIRLSSDVSELMPRGDARGAYEFKIGASAAMGHGSCAVADSTLRRFDVIRGAGEVRLKDDHGNELSTFTAEPSFAGAWLCVRNRAPLRSYTPFAGDKAAVKGRFDADEKIVFPPPAVAPLVLPP